MPAQATRARRKLPVRSTVGSNAFQAVAPAASMAAARFPSSIAPRKASVRWIFASGIALPPASAARRPASVARAAALRASGHAAKKSRPTSEQEERGETEEDEEPHAVGDEREKDARSHGGIAPEALHEDRDEEARERADHEIEEHRERHHAAEGDAAVKTPGQDPEDATPDDAVE